MEKKTALYDEHVAAGGKMIPFAGYLMPVRYTGDTAEHMIVRESAGLFDVSHMGEFYIKGDKALELLQKITTNDVSKLPIGKAQYSCLTHPNGGIVDDLIIYHCTEELYLAVVNAANVEKDWNHFVANNTMGAELTNASEETSLIALSGATAVQVMAKVCDIDLSKLGYYQITRGTVNGVPNTLVATTGYTGEQTFEILCSNDNAVSLWRALIAAGAQPTGLGARDTLRLEMGYMLYGNDLNDDTTPLEAGLAWITRLEKGAFNGSDVLAKQKADGVKRKLIAFETVERGIPRQHHLLAVGGKTVGEVTSGSFSPVLKNGIGMGYVDAEYAVVGNSIDVVIRDKAIACKIVKTPFVKNTSLSRWLKK